MDFKGKLFTLLIFSLLVLPVLLMPAREGNVLGITEANNSNDGNNNQGTILDGLDDEVNQPEITNNREIRPAKIQTISSGVRDVRTVEKEDKDKVLEGKILLDKTQRVSVASNKFSLGKSLTILNGDKQINVVVNQIRQDLEEDVVLTVNIDVFTELGGNPDQDKASLVVQVLED
jgi:hypothetical protein